MRRRHGESGSIDGIPVMDVEARSYAHDQSSNMNAILIDN